MMYRDWVERAIAFTEMVGNCTVEKKVSIEVDPPLSADEFTQLQTHVPAVIPFPIAKFLTSASGSCRCEYVFTIQNGFREIHRHMPTEFALRLTQVNVVGGANLCNSEELAEWNGVSSKSVAGHLTGVASDLWRNCFFFLAMMNGDYLGLDTRVDSEDPPVMYIGHENEAYLVSESFTAFITEWEKTYYLGVPYLREYGFIGRDGRLFEVASGRIQDLEDLHSRARRKPM